jgi:DNA-binding response OmpR family regulator
MPSSRSPSPHSPYPRTRADILLVEDEPELRRQLTMFLAANNLAVHEVATVKEARAILETQNISLALIDIGLGDGSGWDVLTDCQDLGPVPAIIITASIDLKTRVKAFREGAADYVAKPFFIEELLSRITTRLRQQRHETSQTLISFDACVIDLDGRSVTVEGKLVPLTEAEFDILAYLAARPGRAVSRTSLAESALRQGNDRNERTIDSHISRVRAKLGRHANHIVTIWGIGWKFVQIC